MLRKILCNHESQSNMQFKTDIFMYIFFHVKNVITALPNTSGANSLKPVVMCEFQGCFSKEKGIVYMLLIQMQIL